MIAGIFQDQEHDYDLEDKYEESGVGTPLLKTNAAIEEETMRLQGDGEEIGLPSSTRDVAIGFLWALCRNICRPHWAAEATFLLDAYCARVPEEAKTSLAATCIAIVGALMSAEGVPLDFAEMVDDSSMAALSSAGHVFEINEHTKREIRSRQLCLLQTLNGNVKIPSLTWWVAVYGKRLELSIRPEFGASLSWATMLSMRCANAIVALRSLVGDTAPRHIAAGLLGVSVACAGLVSFPDLRPEGMGTEQWQALFLQSRLHTAVPVCRLSQDFAEGMLAALREVFVCSLEDMQTGSAAALELIGAVVNRGRSVE